MVENNINFYQLHLIIQNVMGWTNSHLYQFVFNQNNYIGNPEMLDSDEIANDKEVDISLIFDKPDTKINYEYDFGDGWQHEVNLLEISEPESGKYYPVCLKGERRCPPEDIGGPFGYMEILEVLKGKNTKRKREIKEYLNKDFNPEYFDLNQINEDLKNYTDIDFGFN